MQRRPAMNPFSPRAFAMRAACVFVFALAACGGDDTSSGTAGTTITSTGAGGASTTSGTGAGGAGDSCGPVTCAQGKVCCNRVMGICTNPGDVCIQ